MKDFLKILKLFLIWRSSLFLIAFLAPYFIKEFGGRFPYYSELIASGLPYWIWSFGNFDGVYYLRIAQNGYQDQYSQAFFPFYSVLINFFTGDKLYLLTALVLSNLLFIASLYLLYKLWKLDFSDNIALKSLALLLAFPTSFYFGAVYSESLFLFLIVLSIYLVRIRFFIAGGLIGGLASLTRIFGLILMPLVFVEVLYLVKEKKIRLYSIKFFESVIGLLLIPLGMLLYTVYLKVAFNDPFYFLNSQPAFGAERSAEPFILLPQVIFRYFKILTTVQINTLQYFNAFLELIFTLVPLIILILFFKKIRFSYWLFVIGCLLLPTLTGTLSSIPRYTLMSFLLLPIIVEEFDKYYYVIFGCFVLLAIILISLYTRGYWVA